MGLWSDIKDWFGRAGGPEYSKQQLQDAAKFGIIAKDLMGADLSIRDVVKVPKVLLAAFTFISQHGRPDRANVAEALADAGLLDPPVPDAPPPPPSI